MSPATQPPSGSPLSMMPAVLAGSRDHSPSKATTPGTSNDADDAGSLLSIPRSSHVILTKGKHRWSCAPGSRLENSLGWAVGLLEFANAGDFAANIWNDVPVPLHAVILMAIGGTVAGVLCVFAFLDAAKAWHNITFLRAQRRELQRDTQQQQHERVKPRVSVAAIAQVTTRELRSEVISRWGLDLAMGAGAILISIGTFMAIGGSNHTVWVVSNILSGYLGNTPLACIGVANSAWQAVLWAVMQSHRRTARRSLQGTPAFTSIKRRCFEVQAYAIVNGLTTTIGAVASMLTVTCWWAYVILIPIIISSFLCNQWWRSRLGYDRSFVDASVDMTVSGLIAALEDITRALRMAEDNPSSLFDETAPPQVQLDRVIGFFVDHGLFEVFCVKLVNDEIISSTLVGPRDTRVDMSAETLPALLASHYSDFTRITRDFLQHEGRVQLRYQERFLADVLGTLLTQPNREVEPK